MGNFLLGCQNESGIRIERREIILQDALIVLALRLMSDKRVLLMIDDLSAERLDFGAAYKAVSVVLMSEVLADLCAPIGNRTYLDSGIRVEALSRAQQLFGKTDYTLIIDADQDGRKLIVAQKYAPEHLQEVERNMTASKVIFQQTEV